VINDILDFSKIEAQKVTLERANFSLTDSLDRVRAMQLDAARSKQLPLVLQIDPDVPVVLNGDRLRLEQVLLNLLSNAVKFTPAGRVGLQVRPLGPPAAGVTWLRFEVVDTGIGMTADQLDHVFEAFAQADVSTTRRFGGTGLGLAISKRLVQLMNGRIGAVSQPGQGSTFWVELPLQRAQGPAAASVVPPAAVATQAAALRGLRVLVAEDNPINQEVTATLLGSLGVGVDLVASGEEALRTFDAQRHDLVLMDVQMPGMDGLRATAALRQREDGRTVPIIAMTANAFAEDRQQCLDAGMNDHLAKPVEPQALEQCLRRWRRTPAPAAATEAVGTGDAVLRQRLQATPGLDTRSPLARMRGAWPLYLRTLRMFLEHHAGDADRLAQMAARDDRDGLRALAHSLAGASATVGAVQVQRHAQALQQRLDGGHALTDDAWRLLESALQDLLAQVHAALQTGGGDAPVAAPPSALALQAARVALRQLQPLVDAHDTAALALYERHRVPLETALGPRAQDLARELGNFSFDEAQRTLAQAQQQLGPAPVSA
jgi:CheY-like chemotaxis protein